MRQRNWGQTGQNQANQSAGHVGFGLQLKINDLAGGIQHGHLVGVVAEARARIAQRIQHDEVEVLAVQLVLGVGQLVRSLQRKTDRKLFSPLALAEGGGNVHVFHQLQRQRFARFLIFSTATWAGR